MKYYNDESTLDDLAYVLCHDLGAPSRALRQYLVMVQHARDQKDDVAISKWLDRMSTVLDRLDQRLDDVLSVSQSGINTAPVETDPGPFFQALATDLALSVAIESSQAWPLSKEQTRIVVEEVLKNVRDHGGGVATIRATKTGIECSDKGPGISCEAKDVFLLFRPVHPASSKNRGLGLARVSRVVQASGGSVSLQCPDDGGTIVNIDFPVKG